jgi:hypothetical protein
MRYGGVWSVGSCYLMRYGGVWSVGSQSAYLGDLSLRSPG